MSVESNELLENLQRLEKTTLGYLPKKSQERIIQTQKNSPIEKLKSSNALLLGIPLLIIAILWKTRPKFVHEQITDENGGVIYTFSIAKVVMFSLIFSLLIFVGFYGYTHRNDLNNFSLKF